MHGLNFIVEDKFHRGERVLWIVLALLASFGAIRICWLQWDRFLANPTVISLEKNYEGWNGTLLAITLCYYQKVDPDKAEKFIKKEWGCTPNETDYPYFMEYIRMVAEISMQEFFSFTRFIGDGRFDATDMVEVVMEVHPDYELLVTSFDKNEQVKVYPVLTESGLCYSMNAPLSRWLSPKEKEFEPPINHFITCQFGRRSCFMNIDIATESAMLAIHSPYEVPLSEMAFISMSENDFFTTTYKITETVANENIKELTEKQRKCRFFDGDRKLEDIYSINLCLLNCRAKKSIQTCGCKPFFYESYKSSVPQCVPGGLLCLSNLDWLPSLEKCGCSPPCTELLFIENTSRKDIWAVDESVSAKEKLVFRSEILPSKVRLVRTLLFSFEDLLVSFGGSASLFIGFHLGILFQLIEYLVNRFVRVV